MHGHTHAGGDNNLDPLIVLLDYEFRQPVLNMVKRRSAEYTANMDRIALFLCLVVVSSPIAARAQGRSGGRSATTAAHFAPAPRLAFSARPAPPATAPYNGFASLRSAYRRPIAVAPVYSAPYYAAYYPSYSYGAAYPTDYSTYAAPTPVPYSDAYGAPDYGASSVAADLNDLSDQIQQLTAEVEQLRAEQAERENSTSPASQQPSMEGVPTILVFRDGHRMEIHNYAIAGETLWVVASPSTIRISLSDLDLDATLRVNRDNGVRFVVPQGSGTGASPR